LEVFDDDLLDEDDDGSSTGRKRKDKKPKKPKLSKSEKEGQKQDFRSIRDMMINQSSKRKRPEESGSSSINHDELLGDIMNELHEEKKPKIIPGSSRNLERTKVAENILECGKIREEKPFLGPSKVSITKKKYVAFQMPEVKSEPLEAFGEFSSHDNFDDGFGNDDDFIAHVLIPENLGSTQPEESIQAVSSTSTVKQEKIAPVTSQAIIDAKEKPEKHKAFTDPNFDSSAALDFVMGGVIKCDINEETSSQSVQIDMPSMMEKGDEEDKVRFS